MQVLTRVVGCVLLAAAFLAIAACGGGGSDDGASVMPTLLTGANESDPGVGYWVSNSGTGSEILLLQFFQNGEGGLTILGGEGLIFLDDGSGNSRQRYSTLWTEPSPGTIVVTFVPAIPGYGVRLTSIVVEASEDGFTARATALDDQFIDLTFTRQVGPIPGSSS